MTSTADVYLHVVEDVIKNVKADFQSEGIDESVLQEFRALWERKLMDSGSLKVSTDDNAQPAANLNRRGGLTGTDLNMPYEMDNDYASQLLTGQPLVGNPPRQLREPMLYSHYNLEAPVLDSRTPDLNIDPSLGRPDLFMMKPGQWDGATHQPRLNPNIALQKQMDGGRSHPTMPSLAPTTQDFFTAERKRKRDNQHSGYSYIPQSDGCAEMENESDLIISFKSEKLSSANFSKDKLLQMTESQSVFKPDTVIASTLCNPPLEGEENDHLYLLSPVSTLGNQIQIKKAYPQKTTPKQPRVIFSSTLIPQCDGEDFGENEEEPEWEGDGPEENAEEEEEEEEEDYNAPRESATPLPPSTPATDDQTKVADEEPPLGADDDEDDLDDLKDGEDEPQTTNLVVATYDKVTRSKNRWKCTLKDGIMHLNGRDILFVKATGEFEF